MKESTIVSGSHAVCPFHSGLEAKIEANKNEVDLRITAVCLKMDERKEQVNIKFDALNKEIVLAKDDMERRLEGMNGLEARTTARTQEAESRVREQTAVAERKLAEQAAHFITRGEVDSKLEIIRTAITSDIKVLSSKIDTLVNTSGFSTGSRKWSDHILTVLIAAGVMLLIHFLFKF